MSTEAERKAENQAAQERLASFDLMSTQVYFPMPEPEPKPKPAPGGDGNRTAGPKRVIMEPRDEAKEAALMRAIPRKSLKCHLEIQEGGRVLWEKGYQCDYYVPGAKDAPPGYDPRHALYPAECRYKPSQFRMTRFPRVNRNQTH